MGTQREQCSPPQPGDIAYRGHTLGRVGPDGAWRPQFEVGAPRPPLAARLADAVFCSACLRLRVSPGHLLVCSDRRRRVIRRARGRS